MTSPHPVADFRAAASLLGDHPQDHGWRELYRLFAYGLAGLRAPRLAEVLLAAHARRPNSSHVHLVTMLGIAVRRCAGVDTGRRLVADEPPACRLSLLERLLGGRRREIERLLNQRQNSFTAVRRFLVPQVLLAAYFTAHRRKARFADLGTGLGVLPRQLNSRTLYERYCPDLVWPDGQPAYRPVPIEVRYGVDRGPFPDLRWVRDCYGPSDYYDRQLRELEGALVVPEVAQAPVGLAELDLTDLAALRRFVREHRVNAVNLCYALYELAPHWREAVVNTLRETLPAPGVIIVTEPRQELTRPGCTVTVHDQSYDAGWAVCQVSDGHFRGAVTPLPDFERFVRRYPIAVASTGEGA